MKFKLRSPDDLKEYENNPNKHSASQVNQIAQSIKEFGFNVPIVIDAKGEVKAGHGRLAAAKKLKLKEVPTIEIDGLTDAQWRAFVITDNKLTRNSTWDDELLKSEMESLYDAGFDLKLTGFTGQEINELLAYEADPQSEKDPDDVPPVDPEGPYICEFGEVWQLGDHRLMVGDSTDANDVQKLMDGETAQMMWIDPPYNVNYESSDGKNIANDHMADPEFETFLDLLFSNASDHMDNGAAFYVAHAHKSAVPFYNAINRAGLGIRQQLIWVKNALVLGRSDYQWRHEPIYYGWKPGASHQWNGLFDKTTVIEKQPKELAKMSKAELLELLTQVENENTIMRVPKPMKSGAHPTMKPVDLIIPHINNSSTIGETVIDFCGGSGSTLIACEMTKRKCRTMEYDPKYADSIIRRYQEFTGDHPVKL